MPKPKVDIQECYGLWETIEEIQPSDETYDPNHKGHRRRLLCRCGGCGAVRSVLLENLNRGRSRGCSKCRARIRKKI